MSLPIRSRSSRINRIIIHVLFWACYIYYQGIIYNWQNTDELKFEMSFHTGGLPIIVTIALTYFNLYWLLPGFYYRKQEVRYVAVLVTSLFAGALLTRMLTHVLIVPWEKVHDPERYVREVKQFWIPGRIVRLAIQYYPVIAIVTVFELIQKAYADQKSFRRLEQDRAMAEMNFLKAQINPHFFFNTLNSLYALIINQSEKAAELVLQLSELMRYSLVRANSRRVRLEEEIAYLKNYLHIAQLRFASRLELSFHCSGSLENKEIMPLVLLVFAENAFKHGIEMDRGWVTINLKISGSQLYYCVENSKQAQSLASSTGIGLPNLKRRLELEYPGLYELVISDTSDSFKAILKIEL